MTAPLADRMRPQTLDQYIGQTHLVGEGKLLRRAIEKGQLFSMVLWGPPGVGKTTLARIIAKETNAPFYEFSAVTTGIAEIKKVIETVSGGLFTPIVFVDEIHRFNKAQQDAFLPLVESGKIIFIGATTENPSFEIIKPLLSRVRVLVLKQLEKQDFEVMVDRALADNAVGLGGFNAVLEEDARNFLIEQGGGDGRWVLTTLELAVLHADSSSKLEVQNSKEERNDRVSITNKQLSRKSHSEPFDDSHTSEESREEELQSSGDSSHAFAIAQAVQNDGGGDKRLMITKEIIFEAMQEKRVGHDKGGEAHYDLISAFIKSMRASNADAALYYLARMVEGGEDPLFIARRMVIFASEDVGIAQPTALVVANAVFRACEVIGYPECKINLAQGAVYLAKCPKDRRVYDGIMAAVQDVREKGELGVPMKLRNAPTGLMKELGYGKDYQMYDEGDLLPEELKGKKYFG